MDCSQYGDDIPERAHAALQYVSVKADKYGVYKDGMAKLANAIGCTVSEAMDLWNLLKEIDAVVPGTVGKNGRTSEDVYLVDVYCVCPTWSRTQSSQEDPTPARQASAASAPLPTSSQRSASSARQTRKGMPRPDSFAIGSDPTRWNSSQFARYFGQELLMRAFSYAGPVNIRAVASNISKWKRQSVEPEVIKGMIDVFCSDPGRWMRDGQPAWKAFIYNSTRLQREVQKTVEASRLEEATVETLLGSRRSLAEERFERIRSSK